MKNNLHCNYDVEECDKNFITNFSKKQEDSELGYITDKNKTMLNILKT